MVPRRYPLAAFEIFGRNTDHIIKMTVINITFVLCYLTYINSHCDQIYQKVRKSECPEVRKQMKSKNVSIKVIHFETAHADIVHIQCVLHLLLGVVI